MAGIAQYIEQSRWLRRATVQLSSRNLVRLSQNQATFSGMTHCSFGSAARRIDY